jgi:Peptidase A4 family
MIAPSDWMADARERHRHIGVWGNKVSRAIRLGIGASIIAATIAVVGATSAAGLAYQKTKDFAGYEFNSSKVPTASARFTVPTVTCSGGNSGIGPGLFVVTTKRMLVGAGLIVSCQGAVVRYQMVTAIGGNEQPGAVVEPEDVVFVQVHVSGKGSSVTIRDLTANASHSQSGTGGRSSYVAVGDAAVLSYQVQLGVDRFTPVTFTNVVIQGKALARWRPYAVERYRGSASHPIVQIRPGKLSHAGESFPLSFVHS